MSADDPLDAVTGSISDGSPVDWGLAESSAGDDEQQARLHTLRDIERVAQGFHALQASPVPGEVELGAESATNGPGERKQWGDLVVLELARSGASGEVWRAWDPWLQREVALKFLLQVHDATAKGVEESALLTEARALARVRHPGVVAVHGIAEHDGRVGMWMEFLEGATLAAEIERRGALPPEAVARIGLALCKALEAVESAGVVHRDIKPSNVVLERTGRVVLTDFGLGRRWELGDRGWRASGTPIFMSPGVLSGEPATPRSDLYALGVTLRWALTGRPPFVARNLEQLKAEAEKGPSTPLAAECPGAPRALVAAIERAMAPDPDARFSGAAQMASALEAILDDGRKSRRATIGWLAGAGAAALLIAVWFLSVRWQPQPLSSVTRFSVSAPPNSTLDGDPMSSVVSPDGLQLALVATDSNQVSRLWVRPLRSLSAHVLEGTEGAGEPFWSPDSRSLGYFANGKLMKVSVGGGAPEVLCPAPDARGGTWGTSGVIVFAPHATGGLERISAEGGHPTPVAEPDSSRHETALRWPQFLPDGKRFAFVTLPARHSAFDVYVSSLDSPARHLLVRSDAAPIVAGKDQLLLVADGHLMTQRIDFRSLRPLGEPISRGPSPLSDVSVGEPLASASMNGVLAYQSTILDNTRFLWLDRSGRRQGFLPVPEGRYEKMRFSPDGRRLLVIRRNSQTDVGLGLVDGTTGLETRLTAGSQTRIGGNPAWSPDGRRVAFSSNRDGPTNIFVKKVDDGAPEELLYQSSALFKEVDLWSPDNKYLVFEEADAVTQWDIWLLPLQGEPKPIPYLRTRFGEIPRAFSPDGTWLAYFSDETGTRQVCVQTFPVAGEKHVISDLPSQWCAWSRDGKEIVFLTEDGVLWSVPVTTVPTFHEGTPRRLFRVPDGQLWIAATPDLHRFLSLVPAGDAPPTTITVVLEWPAEREKRTASR